MLHKVMVKKLGMVLLAVSASALLGGCLVEQKDPEDVVKIDRKTDTLRIYQNGDFIDYDVTAIINSSFGTDPVTKYGTLRIQWANTAVLTDPIDPGKTYNVLKETTTLKYDGEDNPSISARYISQKPVADPNQGSIILYAIDDEVDADYWLYPDGSTPSNTAVSTPVIFESPLLISNDLLLSFSVMECDTTVNQCDNEFYKFTDNIYTVGDTHEITTDLGIFTNPFELTFTGGTTPAGSQAISFLGDIRHACGTSADNISFNGDMFVMPEIGIIHMNNFCQNISDNTSVQYIITAQHTSFTY